MAIGRALSALAFAAAAIGGFPTPLLAQVQITPVVSSLTQPVFVGHAGDNTNRLFILERAGRVLVLQPGASMGMVFLDISSKVRSAGGEQGLLGLAFHPQYSSNNRFFVFYTRESDGAIQISEFRTTANPDIADSTEFPLLTIPHPGATNHNGGMLAFGADGYLYIGVGDGGSGNDPPNNAQNLNVLLGKILRIDINTGSGYLIPPTNPFAGPAAGSDEIFAYGLRNPWRFSVDRSTGQLWLGDVGQGAKEEVDAPIVSGGNYGWRVFEGTTCTNLGPASCNPANYIAPVIEYTHAGGRCSVTGGYVYRGSLGTFTAGTYVYGDYCTGEIFTSLGDKQTLLLDTAMNISSFGEDQAGEIYVLNFSGGTIGRLARSMTGGDGNTTCTSPKPGSDWVCVQGGWLPPSMAPPGGSTGDGSTTPNPTGCTTQKPASDWVCVNGGWLPPSMAPSGGSTSGGSTGGGPTAPSPTGCTTQQPASDWVCVNGGWLPPSMAPAGGSTGGETPTPTPPPTPPSSPGLPLCTSSTGAPGSGWVMLTSGGWVPSNHDLAASGVCRAP